MRRALLVIASSLGLSLPGDAPRADESRIARVVADAGPTLLRHETQHFVLLSDAPASWARSRAALLERSRDQFLRFARRADIPLVEPRDKMLAIAFDRHEDYAAYAARDSGMAQAWMAGYYSPASNHVVFYNDAHSPAMIDAEESIAGLSRDLEARIEKARAAAGRARQSGDARAADDIERRCDEARESLEAQARTLRQDAAAFTTSKTIHEAIHLLSFNMGVQRPGAPQAFWFSEGLASAFETQDPGSAFGPERQDPAWDREIDELKEARGLLPLGELVGLAEPPRDPSRIRAAYAQSRALVRWLDRHDRQALGAFARALRDEPPGSITPDRLRELFERSAGDLDEIERRLRWKLVTARSPTRGPG